VTRKKYGMKKNQKSIPQLNSSRGTVLIVTMWIVLVLAGLVLVFSRSMRVEAIASANHIAAVQADNIARGGLQFILDELGNEQENTLLLEGDNSYEGIKLGDGYFWILHPNRTDDRNYSFGISDESSKINLNSATQEMLLKLPGMTAELAASIIDWRDEDSEVTPGGAESEYYLLLPDSYYCKDAPLETVMEVLLIKGTTHEILFGEDTNRNGFLDSNENDADYSDPPDNKDGHLDRGFYDYVTVYSRESNLNKDGKERVNINEMRNQGKLSDILRKVIKDDRIFQIMDNVRRRRPFQNILDFYYRSGLTISEFDQIADELTTQANRTKVGLVNINTASSEVLYCLPGLAESDVDAIITKRSSLEESELDTLTWITEVLPQEKAVAIGSHISNRSSQYSADVISVSGNGRAYKRYKVVVDMQHETPRVLYWKSITDLGWPLQPEIISRLRSGVPLN